MTLLASDPKDNHVDAIGKLLPDAFLDDGPDDDGEQATGAAEPGDVDGDDDGEPDVRADDAETSDDDSDETAEETQHFETLAELAEAAGVESIDDFTKAIKHKFKAAGEEREVTLADLISSHQQQAHVTQKSMMLSEQRRQNQMREQTRMQAFQHMADRLGQEYNAAHALIEAQMNSPLMRNLEDTDFEGYMRAKEYLNGQRQQIEQQYQATAQQIQAQEQQQRQVHLQEAQQQIMDAHPDWGPEHKALASSTFRSLGYTEQEIDTLSDPRAVLAIHELGALRKKVAALEKATSKETVQAKIKAAKKLKKAPRLSKPTPKRTANTAAGKSAKLRKRARRTGKINDVAAVLEDNPLLDSLVD